MFGHVAQVLILIKRAKDVSIKRYISRSRKQYAHTLITHATPCKNFFETCGACTRLCVRTRKFFSFSKRDYATIKQLWWKAFYRPCGMQTLKLIQSFFHQIQDDVKDNLLATLEGSEVTSLKDDLLQRRIIKHRKTDNFHLVHVARPPPRSSISAEPEVEIVEIRDTNGRNEVSGPKRHRSDSIFIAGFRVHSGPPRPTGGHAGSLGPCIGTTDWHRILFYFITPC